MRAEYPEFELYVVDNALPCACGELLALEAVRQRGVLLVRALWPEPGARGTPALRRGVEAAAQRLCTLNECARADLSALDA